MTTIKHGWHKHIDNGGVSLEFTIVHGAESLGHFCAFSTQYFGYPSVRSALDLSYHCGSGDYRAIAKFFNECADKLEAVEKLYSGNQ